MRINHDYCDLDHQWITAATSDSSPGHAHKIRICTTSAFHPTNIDGMEGFLRFFLILEGINCSGLILSKYFLMILFTTNKLFKILISKLRETEACKMKKVIGLVLLSCPLVYATETVNSVSSSADSMDWQLVWNDEFNYQGLPDPQKWGYEEGFIRNNEEQYYTVNRKENARVENGTLVIEGHKEAYPNVRYQPDSDDWRFNRKEGQYTSASITTLGKVSWTYGKIEVRAKLPQGKGIWPAIWTLGENRIPPIGESKTGTVTWPFCGEIDIMEFVGKEPNHIYGTIHFADQNNKHKSDGGKVDFDLPPVNDFHTYTTEWSKGNIKFFVDGKLFHTADTTKSVNNAFDKPHYLLINLALGGEWGGEIDDSVLPQKYLVDYVRVYQKKN